MAKDIKPVTKKYSLSEEKKSDYFFYFRLAKEWEMMAGYWRQKLNWVCLEAVKRNAIDPQKYNINWDNILENGTFTATLNAKPELQKESSKGNPGKK